jgi:hypothetical protein
MAHKSADETDFRYAQRKAGGGLFLGCCSGGSSLCFLAQLLFFGLARFCCSHLNVTAFAQSVILDKSAWQDVCCYALLSWERIVLLDTHSWIVAKTSATVFFFQFGSKITVQGFNKFHRHLYYVLASGELACYIGAYTPDGDARRRYKCSTYPVGYVKHISWAMAQRGCNSTHGYTARHC